MRGAGVPEENELEVALGDVRSDLPWNRLAIPGLFLGSSCFRISLNAAGPAHVSGSRPPLPGAASVEPSGKIPSSLSKLRSQNRA